MTTPAFTPTIVAAAPARSSVRAFPPHDGVVEAETLSGLAERLKSAVAAIRATTEG